MQTLDQANEERLKKIMRGAHTQRDAEVLCPLCLKQMHYLQPGVVLTSLPPKMEVKCGNCGYVDYLIV